MGMITKMNGAGQEAILAKNRTSYKTLGQLLLSLHGDPLLGNDDTESIQKRGIFQKQHILNIAHSSMEPQRDYMYMLYISDIPGSFWTYISSNYPSFVKRLVTYAYAISVGTISTAVYLGMVKMLALKGKTGTSSPQQELVYRASSVTIPHRAVKEVETSYIGGLSSKHPTAINYEGDLSVTFEESEDGFILRQFMSWMNVVDEETYYNTEFNAILALDHLFSLTKTSSKYNSFFTKELTFKGLDHNSFDDIRTKMKTDIELFMFRYSGDDIGYKIKFFNCYPKVIGDSQWSYNNNGTISYTINFSYDYFKVIYIPYPLVKKNTNNFRSVWAQTVDKLLQFGANALFMYLLRVLMAKKTQEMLSEPARVPNRDIIQHVKELRDKVEEKKAYNKKMKETTNPKELEKIKKSSASNLRLDLNNAQDNTNPNKDVIEHIENEQNANRKARINNLIHQNNIKKAKNKTEYIRNKKGEPYKVDEAAIEAETQLSELNKYIKKEPSNIKRDPGLNDGIDNTNPNLDIVNYINESKNTNRKARVRQRIADNHKQLAKNKAEYIREKKGEPYKVDEAALKAETGINNTISEEELKAKQKRQQVKSDLALTQLNKEYSDAIKVKTKARDEAKSKSENAITNINNTISEEELKAKQKRQQVKSNLANTKLDDAYADAIKVKNKARSEAKSKAKDALSYSHTTPLKKKDRDSGLNGGEDNTNLSEIAIEEHKKADRSILPTSINARLAKIKESIRPGLNGGEDNINIADIKDSERPGLNGGKDNVNLSDIKDSERPGLNGGKDNVNLSDINK